MGESVPTPVRLQSDRWLDPGCRGTTMNSEVGLLACRKLDVPHKFQHSYLSVST